MSWYVSRHPDMDRDFYERNRAWPHEDRLFVKRFKEGGFETGYVMPAEGRELEYDLFVSGALSEERLSVDDLIGAGWEVD